MEDNQKYTGLEIAIVGMACRFPGAKNWRAFWNNLVNGKESIVSLTQEELIARGMKMEEILDDAFVNAAAVMDDKENFDAAFFDYMPHEAALMHPMHRVFHECVWEALEDAGYNMGTNEEPIGLYAGAGNDLNWKVYSLLKNNEQDMDEFSLNFINNKDFLASLLSYKLNLKGPVFSMHTACSTSLVAINMACKSLLLGETRMAVAGGISLSTQKQHGYVYKEGMIQSRDGHCRAFDKEADGTVDGEGAGVVVLKRLTEAIKDKDHIYAIIKGTAINNDGNRKVGYTAPSVEGQVDCIKRAQKYAHVTPDTISYMEAHGTATKLGDPIEVAALNIAFGGAKDKTCAIGSVKTNIGHPDAAAGVAGLIKTALSLKYKLLPASLHFTAPNPEIDFDGGPFYVNHTLKEWTTAGVSPLRAGVSSFGIGGTNAHVILEEAPSSEREAEGRAHNLFMLSARSEKSLNMYLDKLRNFVRDEPYINLTDLACTLQKGRKSFTYRRSFVFSSKEELAEQLGNSVNQLQPAKTADREKEVVFMFSGAGSQYVNMGRGLYETEPFFKMEMDKGFDALKRLTGIDYKHIFYPSDEATAGINEMLHTQPAIFVFGYALARLMMFWGLRPKYMIGHSIGEYTAACLSGVFTYEDTLRLVIKRGQLMDSMPRGSMISLFLKEEEAGPYLNESISLAAINGPEQVVLSGACEAMEALELRLEKEQITYVKLRTSHAGHAPTIDSILEPYRALLQTIEKKTPVMPFISNLTGSFIREEEALSDEYWLRHMRETIQFSRGIAKLIDRNPETIFVEIGGGHALTSLVKQQPATGKFVAANLVRHPKETEHDDRFLLEQLGKLWLLGIPVDWQALYANERRTKVSLPTYPFEPIKYPALVDPFAGNNFNAAMAGVAGDNSGLKNWIYIPVWKQVSPYLGQDRRAESRYLFFSMNDECADGLKAALQKHPGDLVEVISGKEYKKISAGKYMLDPMQEAHFKSLAGDLQKEAFVYTDIIYCWGMLAATGLELEIKNEALNLGYFSLLRLTQCLLQDKDRDKKRVFIITDLLHKVTGNEKINYEQALSLGIANTLPQEYNLSCYHIDIDRKEAPGSLVGRLTDAMLNHEEFPRTVALRNNKWWVQDYQPYAKPVENKKPVLKKGGIYLITGGLGNVGFLLAKYLIREYDAKLILTGRRILPEEETKTDAAWLSRWHDLKNISANVHYYPMDIADADALRRVAADTERVFKGRIQGVVHTAGVLDKAHFELIEGSTAGSAITMFEPKIKGLKNIYEVFNGAELDFVWITSSLASVVSGLGFCSYAAANAYMEYFVTAKEAELPGWRCIGLGEMIFEEDKPVPNRKALLAPEITRLFDWSLEQSQSAILFETVEPLGDRIYKAFHAADKILEAHTDNRASGPRSERPALSNSYVAPESETELKLTQLIESFLGIEGIGIEDNFFELGGDSLKAMVLLKRIKKEFEINLSLKDFFNARNIKQIAEELEERLWIEKNSEKQFISVI